MYFTFDFNVEHYRDAVGARKPSVIAVVINFVISDSDDDCGGVRFRPHFLLFFRVATVTRHDRAGYTGFQSVFSVQRTYPEGRVVGGSRIGLGTTTTVVGLIQISCSEGIEENQITGRTNLMTDDKSPSISKRVRLHLVGGKKKRKRLIEIFFPAVANVISLKVIYS